jgi:nucleotide-binding universal stress UspA family protein
MASQENCVLISVVSPAALDFEEGLTMKAFKKILFPTDFSKNADKALAHAIRLADFDGGEVIVQHVVADYFEKHPHWATLFDVHELQKFMYGYVSAHVAKIVPDSGGDVRVRTLISKGKPADEIVKLADREMVDLVVMGSAKGVVTNRVMRMTNRPVLAVSATQPAPEDLFLGKLKKILVATDFSEHSKRVVQYAFDLKRVFDASIYMLYVIETTHAIEWAIRQGHFTHGMEKLREWAGNQLVNLTPDEFINDPTVIRLIETGSPSDAIANAAFEIGADLTILGTHEYGMAHKYLIGATTDKLLTKTSTPVLTVKL